MTKVFVDLTNNHMQIILKHGEETGLLFDAALIDLIEMHADRKACAVRETLKAVQDHDSSVGGVELLRLRSEKLIAIQEIYPLALTMPIDVPFTLFDVIELLPNSKAIQVTDDQMRGWGTPFSNWISKHSDIFQVEANTQPRKYIRNA